MESTTHLSQEPNEPLSAKQQRFVEEYCADFNATQAAIRAGYSKNETTAAVSGHRMLRNAKIFAAIKIRLNELAMTAEEAIKLLSDVANTRMQDYMIVRNVERPTRARKSLQQLIDELETEMTFEWEFAALAELDEDELKIHEKKQKERRRQLLRYQLELKHNPQAFRDVDGPVEIVERMELDLVALSKARDKGRIKSLSFTEHGPRVELYAADAAADKLLQVHGRYKAPVDDNPKAKEVFVYLKDGQKITFG